MIIIYWYKGTTLGELQTKDLENYLIEATIFLISVVFHRIISTFASKK